MEANKLSDKQYDQLFSFTTKTRSYVFPESIPIIELMQKCGVYCLQPRFIGYDYSNNFIKSLNIMIKKYYPYGYKENKGFYNGEQYNIIENMGNIRFSLSIFPTKVKPIEKVIFIRTLRSCYKFLKSKYTEEDKIALIDSLEQIRILALN